MKKKIFMNWPPPDIQKLPIQYTVWISVKALAKVGQVYIVSLLPTNLI